MFISKAYETKGHFIPTKGSKGLGAQKKVKKLFAYHIIEWVYLKSGIRNSESGI